MEYWNTDRTCFNGLPAKNDTQRSLQGQHRCAPPSHISYNRTECRVPGVERKIPRHLTLDTLSSHDTRTYLKTETRLSWALGFRWQVSETKVYSVVTGSQSQILGMQDPINATRNAPLFQPHLTRRDRYDRRALLVSRVGEREEKHDKRKKALGRKVFVVDPVPVFTIRHGGKGIVGFFRRAENPDKWRHADTVD
jgi:hypothetical protein